MTEGGGEVKQSQWDYEYLEIFLMFPRMPGVLKAYAGYIDSKESAVFRY